MSAVWRQLPSCGHDDCAAADRLGIPPIPLAGTALVYRWRPSRDTERPFLLNGQIAGISERRAFIDIVPNHYSITVDSYLHTYVNQFADLTSAPTGSVRRGSVSGAG
jgi:hypothetical protein